MNINDKIGLLTLVEDLGSIEYGTQGFKKRWGRFICDCGVEKDIIIYSVTSGNTRSCGCVAKEVTSELFTKHQLSGHSLMSTWLGMKQRCGNKNSFGYKDYGGRGIKVCDEWKNNFKSFYDWMMLNGWEIGLQIDRIDNDGNYEPNNCQVVTPKVNNAIGKKRIQTNNKSGHRGVHFDSTRKLWVASIKNNGKGKFLGRFKTKEDAVLMRQLHEILLTMEGLEWLI